MDTNLDSRRVTFDPAILTSSSSKLSKDPAFKHTREMSEPSRENDKKQILHSVGTLFMFSFAMLVLPLGSYFFIRHIANGSSTVAAVSAIIAVQIIIVAFVYKAFIDSSIKNEKSNQKCAFETKKKKQ